MTKQSTTIADPTADVDDLQRQIDSLLSRLDAEPLAGGNGGAPNASEPIETPASANIEALDRQLAELSEELLQQDGDAEPASTLPRSAPDVSAGAKREEQEAQARTQQRPKPSETLTAPAPPPLSMPSTPPVEPALDPAAVAGDEASATERSRTGLRESVCGALADAIEPVARRVSAMPRGVRDSIGWIGAMTLFYAGCVWTVVLVLRGSGVEPPDAPPPEIAPAVQTTGGEGKP